LEVTGHKVKLKSASCNVNNVNHQKAITDVVL
jgi:hypothetical protein